MCVKCVLKFKGTKKKWQEQKFSPLFFYFKSFSCFDYCSNILLKSSALTVLSFKVTFSLMATPSFTSMQRSMRLSTVSRFFSISFTEFSRYSSGMFNMPY